MESNKVNASNCTLALRSKIIEQLRKERNDESVFFINDRVSTWTNNMFDEIM
jgi:hypothetical protein